MCISNPHFREGSGRLRLNPLLTSFCQSPGQGLPPVRSIGVLTRLRFGLEHTWHATGRFLLGVHKALVINKLQRLLLWHATMYSPLSTPQPHVACHTRNESSLTFLGRQSLIKSLRVRATKGITP